MLWDSYHFFTCNPTIKQLKTSPKKIEKEKDDRKIIWIRLPYLCNIGDNMRKEIIKMFKENTRFITFYDTKKTAVFWSAKDSTPIHQKGNIINKVTCPGCNQDFIGKSNRSLVTNELGSHKDQPYQLPSKCEHFAHIIDLIRLPDVDTSTTEINNKQHFVNSAMSSFCVLDTSCN